MRADPYRETLVRESVYWMDWHRCPGPELCPLGFARRLEAGAAANRFSPN